MTPPAADNIPSENSGRQVGWETADPTVRLPPGLAVGRPSLPPAGWQRRQPRPLSRRYWPGANGIAGHRETRGPILLAPARLGGEADLLVGAVSTSIFARTPG